MLIAIGGVYDTKNAKVVGEVVTGYPDHCLVNSRGNTIATAIPKYVPERYF